MKFLQRKGNYNATNKQAISCCLLPMQWANGATKIARKYRQICYRFFPELGERALHRGKPKAKGG